MKLHFVFSVIFLWCVFLCTSCDKQSVVEPAVEEDGSVVLTIKPQGFIHDSDIEYNHSGGGILDSINNSLNWMEKDSLYVKTISGKELKFFYQDDDQNHYSFICAEKDVQELDDIQFVRYPLLDTLSDNRVSISIEGQVQSSNPPLAHLRKYNYRMWSASTDPEHRNNEVFELRELTSILHISIVLPIEIKEPQNLVLKTTGSFVVDQKYDYLEGTIIPGKRKSALSVKLDNIQSTGEVLDFYLVLLPSQLKGESINVRVYSKDGLCFTSDVEGIDFREGRLYEIETTCRIDESYTGLAQVYIDTPDDAESINHNKWMGDARVVIITPEGIVDYEDDKLNIKGRGNMTWFDSPKKPYAIKLNKKAKLLGMPKGKRWCLLANFFDRTLMRNDIAFQIASMTGLGWTPKGQFVELIMNGKHVGNYYLCEQIKIDENRVNIKEMTSTDIEGDDVTGGYLVEVDTYYDEVNKFRSKEKSFPYMFKSPDEETLQIAQFEYFKNYVDSMETKMYSEDWLESAEYRDFLDLNSFADFWIINELATNQEIMHPKSTYLHKDRLNKLTAGPVWDYDCSTFVASRTNYFIVQDVFYYARLFSDPVFVRIVKDRWQELKPNLITIPDYIRKTANMIKKSNDINIKMWPITIVCNGDESFSFEEAVDNLVLTYNKKFKWMSEQIEKW